MACFTGIRRTIWFMLSAGFLSAVAGACSAADDECADCRRATRHARAGCAQQVSAFAVPSNTRNYGWYYVGGGSVFGHADERFADEGTFGWDYNGILFPKQIALAWSHGRRYQGGTGAYRTVGFAPHRTQ